MSQSLKLVLLFMSVSIASRSHMIAQQGFEVPLTISDGVSSRTLYFGILPGASICIVPSDSMNGHIEFAMPPTPPTGAFDARFVWPRSGTNIACYGQGSANDFRPFVCIVQRDTFRVRAQMGTGTSLTVSWPSGLGAHFEQLALRYFDGSANVNVNMLTTTLVDISAGGDPATFTIYGGGNIEGPLFGLNQPSLTFGTLPVGSSATLPVTVVNGGPCNSLSITGATLPPGYTISPNAFPISVAPRDSQVLHVTFTPASSGTHSGDVVFAHNSFLPPNATALPVSGSGFVQTGFEVPITVTDGANTSTLYFGILNGASVCIVPWDRFNGHFEAVLPPAPPAGVYDARFIAPLGRPAACYDQGSLADFRPFTSAAQVDTFRIRQQLGAGTSMILSWPSGLSRYFTELRISYCQSPNLNCTNMLLDTLVDVSLLGDGAPISIFSGGLVVGVKEETGGGLPADFILHQNYPNPFNPTTNLKFQIADYARPNNRGGQGFVSLKVFDVLGREVATLVDGPRNPGEHSVEWNPEGLSGGIYMYRLTTASATITRKMLFLK